ncbi:MAG: 50S ribosomal protein L37 [Thermoproteota archaeon]|nr:50S ribosomal protein L37 [Thermoproteota archaeon]
MAKRKKGSTALTGLGVKFGATVRKRYGKVHRTLHRKRRCPSCGSIRFSRLAAGIWHCPKCNCKIASGAYDIELEKLQS